MLFALTRAREELACEYTLIKTKHSKLLIHEIKRESFATKHRLSVENLDIFTYINSKFVYVEKHIHFQMNLLYRDVSKQCCNLEQQILKSAFNLAINSSDEFAYRL